MKLLVGFISLLLSFEAFSAHPPNYLKSTETRTTGSPRIKIKLNLNSAVIKLDSDKDIILNRKNKIKKFTAGTQIKIKCKKFSKELGKEDLFAEILSDNGIVHVNADTYRGKIKVYKDHLKKKCFVVGDMDIEDYVQSILPREMNASWPIEALKAQAIASRTYALHRLIKFKSKNPNVVYHLENSEKDQVTGSLKDWNKKTTKAIQETRGKVLVNRNKELVPAFFHAKCGGGTLVPGDVWMNTYQSYKRVPDPYCDGAGRPNWKYEVKGQKFEKFLSWYFRKKRGMKGIPGKSVLIANDSTGNPYLNLYINRKTYLVPKSSFRRYFGRFKFQSNHFRVMKSGAGNFIVYGKGHGHGVGMCQIGSLVMSKQGRPYDGILRHYFPNLNIVSYLKR
ncbi:MAG: SpoIID/LytB domain-containing protein [Bacteriovoracaceae bacterium]